MSICFEKGLEPTNQQQRRRLTIEASQGGQVDSLCKAEVHMHMHAHAHTQTHHPLKTLHPYNILVEPLPTIPLRQTVMSTAAIDTEKSTFGIPHPKPAPRNSSPTCGSGTPLL